MGVPKMRRLQSGAIRARIGAMNTRLHLKFMALLVAGSWASAADWPHWRGPDFNGSSPESGLPASFSPTNNIKWTADLPGPADLAGLRDPGPRGVP